MFSPVKAITAGALVFALGGVLLIAQPFDRQAIVPAASVDVEPTWVTGTAELTEDCIKSPTTTDNGVVHERFDCPGQTWTADDPRLTGEVRKMWRLDGYRTEAGYRSVLANRHIVDTEDGTWECESVQVARGTGLMAGIFQQETITCVGDGSYEGLTAVVQMDWGEVGHPFEAVILSGRVQPPPDPSDFE